MTGERVMGKLIEGEMGLWGGRAKRVMGESRIMSGKIGSQLLQTRFVTKDESFG